MLACFFEDEIEAMLCGAGESWTVEALAETIKFDHGYTAQSTAISYFLQARDRHETMKFDHRSAAQSNAIAAPVAAVYQLASHSACHVAALDYSLPAAAMWCWGCTARVHKHLVAS